MQAPEGGHIIPMALGPSANGGADDQFSITGKGIRTYSLSDGVLGSTDRSQNG